MLRKILYGLGIVLLILQFIRPPKNNSGDNTSHVSTRYAVSPEVNRLLETACNDCHSNSTVYPWYSNIQPVGWWLYQHVREGKKHLNFSDFTRRRVAIQNHKFEEVIEMVKEKEMPLASYTWIHRNAVLDDAQRQLLVQWAQSNMDTLRAHYPADSLVLRRK